MSFVVYVRSDARAPRSEDAKNFLKTQWKLLGNFAKSPKIKLAIPKCEGLTARVSYRCRPTMHYTGVILSDENILYLGFLAITLVQS